MSKYKNIFKFLFLFLIMLEILIRSLGLVDFPLIHADNKIGYIFKPNQHGSFLNHNEWKFNSVSMQNDEEFLPSDSLDILLIGDSIVSGGNTFKKEEFVLLIFKSFFSATFSNL